VHRRQWTSSVPRNPNAKSIRKRGAPVLRSFALGKIDWKTPPNMLINLIFLKIILRQFLNLRTKIGVNYIHNREKYVQTPNIHISPRVSSNQFSKCVFLFCGTWHWPNPNPVESGAQLCWKFYAARGKVGSESWVAGSFSSSPVLQTHANYSTKGATWWWHE